MTPSVIEYHERSKRFHAEIARRAALVVLKSERPAPQPVVQIVHEVDYRGMWFFDLVFGRPKRTGPPHIQEIQDVVSKAYGISRQEMVCQRRTGNLIRPRQVAMYLSKLLTPHSYPIIGRRFGGRDHSTVLHAFRKLEVLVEADPELAEKIETIKTELLR